MNSSAKISRPSRGGGAVWRAWVLANAVGELFGLAIPALTGLAMAHWYRRGTAASTLELLVMVAAGALEGLVVGVSQWLVLRRAFQELSCKAWLAWTAGGSAFAWALGMLPGAVIAHGQAEHLGNIPQMSDVSKYLLASAMGLVLGPVLAIPQWFVLRRYAHQAFWWIPANALAWMFGMPIVFFAASEVAQATSVSRMAIIAISTLALTGAVVGAIHGVALLWLAGRTRSSSSVREKSPGPELKAFQTLPLRVHYLLAGVPLHSLDRLELAGGRPGLILPEITVAIGFNGEAGMEVGRVTQALFWLRGQIGRILHWDKADKRWETESFLSRLTAEDRAHTLIAPGTPAGISHILFQFENEMLGEIINRTVHCFWAIVAEPVVGGYHVWFAVYVKRRNWFTPVYMAAISPLLKWIIYPAMLKGARKRWAQLHDEVEQPVACAFPATDPHREGHNDGRLGLR